MPTTVNRTRTEAFCLTCDWTADHQPEELAEPAAQQHADKEPLHQPVLRTTSWHMVNPTPPCPGRDGQAACALLTGHNGICRG